MVATNEERVRYVLEQLGATKTAGEIDQVTGALGRGGIGVEEYNRRAQKAASLATALSGALSGLTPQFGQLAAGVGRAAPAFESLIGLLGGASKGTLVGAGIVGALGLASAAWKVFGDDEDEVRKKTEDLNVTLESTLELIKKIDAARSQQQLLSQGLAGTDVQFAEVRRLEAQRDRLTAERQRVLETRKFDDSGSLLFDGDAKIGGFLFNESRVVERELTFEDRKKAHELQLKLNALEKQIDAARANLNQSRQEDIAFAQEDFEGIGKDDKAPKAAGERELTPEELTRQNQNRAQIEAIKRLQETDKQDAEGLENYLKQRAEAQEGISKAVSDRDEVESRLRIERQRRETEELEREYERRTALAEAHHKAVRDSGAAAYKILSSSTAAAAAATVAGQKFVFADFARAFGSRMVLEGVEKQFEGAGMLLTGNPAGAALFAIGTAEEAAGFAAGGLASAGGKPGGAGGGDQRSTSQRQFDREHPTPASARPSTETGSHAPIIVQHHYHMQSTVAPNAQDAQRIEDAQAEKRRQGL